jgi:hypothetical protein
VFAHPDSRVQRARDDAGQQTAPLFLVAIREKAGRHLPVGDPVGGDGCTVRQQLLGDRIAMQIAKSVAAVFGRDRQADEAGTGKPGGEVGVPLRKPAVDGGPPAELGAICGQKVRDRRTQRGQFAVVGAQGLEFGQLTAPTFCGSRLL